ncbi:hypothetical protein BRADI_1g70400v3 [Brachypodium distachyon]|uniref:Uncharacterized protein n=1 Tax=Brachypodium distachyon TaxID=15368 RepID=I1H894_BRADI|nr:hypothetical protein BRADI_1g70400v3 [Brachypodium distachyon]
MAGRRRSSIEAPLQLPPVAALLLLWIFSWNCFVAIGCEPAFSSAAATTIHGVLGPKTSPADALPGLEIHVENIHKAMHGSGTGALDAKGRFVPQKFEEIFTSFAKIRQDALTFPEIQAMLVAHRDILDPASWAPPQAEWGLIYTLASDWLGFLHKDSVRGIYDGSVFTKLEEKWNPSQSDMR